MTLDARMKQVVIEFRPDGAPQPAQRTPIVEFVDGPWAGRREPMSGPPSSIGTDTGSYRRSVQCADDGALRYVFVADSQELAR